MATVDYINNPFDLPSKPIHSLINTKHEPVFDKINSTVLNSEDMNYTLDQHHQPQYKVGLTDSTDTASVPPPISPISSTSLSPAASLSSSLSTTSSAQSPSARKRYSDFNCHCHHHHHHHHHHRPSQSQPLFQRRHTTSAAASDLSNCVLPDTTVEGRPSIFLFIFVNPLSGDQQGHDLIQLPVQQFRLRRRPHVKVEIHNILDEQDRQNGFEHILWVQNMIRQNQLPPLPITTTDHQVDCHYHPQQQGRKEIQGSCACFKTPTAMTRHIHVYSAGGDGTVMSVFDMLAQYMIDSSLFYFSCIPFGTGNDFSQVLGWGRTTKQTDILGSRLARLESLLLERLDHGEAARLDIWQLVMTCHKSGYVRRAGIQNQQQKQKKDDDDDTTNTLPSQWRSSVPSADFDHYQQQSSSQHPTSLERKMCSYVSIGVQGYVGSGFEQHRAGRRWANIWAYTMEGAKWLFYRKFPPITNFISRIVSINGSNDSGDSILLSFDHDDSHAKREKNGHTSTMPSPPSPSSSSSSTPTPTITKQPIELVIQNIPHIWGRQIDLWGGARSGLEIVKDRSGPTDASLWHPQRANDGHLELMAIGSMFSYIKKLANFRNHVSRVGQFGHPFRIEFKLPPLPPSSDEQQQQQQQRKFTNRYERDNIICIMCDGEFYEVKDPKEICLQRFSQIWTLGKSDDKYQSRLVQDEMQYPNP